MPSLENRRSTWQWSSWCSSSLTLDPRSLKIISTSKIFPNCCREKRKTEEKSRAEMELESLPCCEFMTRTTGERQTIKAIWKCYFCEEMVVNLHLLAQQTALEACWHALKRVLIAAALMNFCVSINTIWEEINENQGDSIKCKSLLKY